MRLVQDAGNRPWILIAPSRESPVSDIKPAKASAAQNQVHGNPSYTMTTNISKPLIAMEFGDQMKLIDKNHRLYKTVKTGKQTIETYFLIDSKHIQYIGIYAEMLYENL